MADDNDHDPVVASYDVFLNTETLKPTLGSTDKTDPRLVILQYPAWRQHSRPYNARRQQQPRSLRLKPQMGLVEVEIPLLGQEDYNPEAGARFGQALAENKTVQAGGSHGLGGGFNNNHAAQYGPQQGHGHGEAIGVEEDPYLETVTLGGKIAVPSEQDPVYFLAAFRNGELHLSPVSAVVQVRPQLHHLDAEDDNASLKRFSLASSSAAGPAAAKGSKPGTGTGIESKAIEIKMKDNKDDARDRGLNEGARLLRDIQAETWHSHEWIDQDDPAALAVRERLGHTNKLAGLDELEGSATPAELKSSLSDGDWLDRMSAPREEGKKGLRAKVRGRERERARRKKAEEEKKRKSASIATRTTSKSGTTATLLEQSSDSDTTSLDGDDTDTANNIKEEAGL